MSLPSNSQKLGEIVVASFEIFSSEVHPLSENYLQHTPPKNGSIFPNSKWRQLDGAVRWSNRMKWGSRCPRSRKLEVFQSKNSDIAVRARHRAQKLALYLYNTQKKIEVIHRSRKDFTAPQSWQATFHKISCENPSKFNKNLKIRTVFHGFRWIFDGFRWIFKGFLWNLACQLWRALKKIDSYE